MMNFDNKRIVGWKYLGPLVADERQKRNQPSHRSKFETLAKLAQQNRQMKYSHEEHFFTLVRDDIEMWKN